MRHVAVVHPLGRTNSFSYNLADRKQIVTDRLGHATTYQFDPRGNVTNVKGS